MSPIEEVIENYETAETVEGVSVIIVEDEPDTRRDIESLLTPELFSVVSVANPEGLQGALEGRQGLFIFILDLRFESDDVQLDVLLNTIESLALTYAVIVLTNFAPQDVIRRHRSSVSAFLTKGKFYKDRNIIFKYMFPIIESWSVKYNSALLDNIREFVEDRIENDLIVASGIVLAVQRPFVKVQFDSYSEQFASEEMLFTESIFRRHGLLCPGDRFTYRLFHKAGRMISEIAPDERTNLYDAQSLNCSFERLSAKAQAWADDPLAD